jgi:hypothetical protein
MKERADVLFLCASPTNADQLQADREARAIQLAIDDAPRPFKLATRWAAAPLDLLRELRVLQPVVLHFSGYGSRGEEPGIYFQDEASGTARRVRPETLKSTLEAAGQSLRAVVLHASHTAQLAAGLLEVVECVIAVEGTLSEKVARAFGQELYRALAEGCSLRAAWERGSSTLEVRDALERGRPQLKTRDGADASWTLT